MDFTNRLFVLFQRTRRFFRHPAVRRPDALENSPLAKLPIELLQQIADSIPVVSAVSFSLSCRHILLLIGTQYLENLATSDSETLVFLKLVERDLRNQIVCNSCRKLHRIQDARKYTEDGQPIWPPAEPDCLSDDREALVTSFIHGNFSTTVFKMAMKHYHHFGYDAQSCRLLKLLSSKFCSENWDTFVRNQKAECQIKDGSLFTYERIAFHGKCTGVKEDSIYLEICAHLECESIGRPTSLCVATLEKWPMLVSCESGTYQKTSRDLCSGLQQCRYCRTEYKAGFEHGKGCTIIFTMAIWKDLGQGPEAEEWKAHFPLEDPRSFPQPIQFHGGEIASVFKVRGAQLYQR